MKHVPVLLQETVSGLAVADGDIIVDATLGSGGHSKALCQIGKKDLTIIGIDADSDAILRAQKNLADCNARFIFENTYNHHITEILEKHKIFQVHRFLFDLGMSSPQLDDSQRGFSFLRDEPLLMTMKKDIDENDLTAQEVVNTWAEESLADIFYGYGDERYSRRIARAIIEYRSKQSIETTGQLVEIIKDATPTGYHRRKTHPATKVFQALRIVVNDEIERHKTALRQAWDHLHPGGRIAVITFHSLEDRTVKRLFRTFEKEEGAVRITKKPISPTREEIINNPRSRSAKLRIVERPINN